MQIDIEEKDPPHNRENLWLALSEFYLDTEMSNEDFDRISKAFVSSGLTLHEIKTIDLYEVFPLLHNNLTSTAGIWDGFDEYWLLEECSKNYKRRNKLIHQLKYRILNRIFYWMRKDYWVQIENRIPAH